MPRHDFECVGCRRAAVDVYLPVSQRASEHAPTCESCGQPMTWIPKLGGLDAYDVRGFTTSVMQPDGAFKPVTVGSLREIRALERQTEQAYRNGEGQPMRWRDYSHDRNNSDRNSFGPSPAEQLRSDLARERRGRGEISTRRGEQVRRDHGGD